MWRKDHADENPKLKSRTPIESLTFEDLRGRLATISRERRDERIRELREKRENNGAGVTHSLQPIKPLAKKDSKDDDKTI